MKLLSTIASWFAPKETDLQVALAQKNPHVHWLPAGACEDGQTEGWYFSDEVQQLRGPYDTYEIAVAYFHTYCETELAVTPVIDGPGTPSFRLTRLMDELQKRFPEAHNAVMSDPGEPKYLAAIDVAAQPVAHALTNQGQQARLGHDAAAHNDALRRHRHDQLGAQLTQVIRLDVPLRMSGIEFL